MPGCQRGQVLLAAILNTAVTVMNQLSAGPLGELAQRHFQRAPTVNRGQRLGHGEAHDAVLVGIGEQREVETAGFGKPVRDIRHPDLIGP